MKKKVASEVEGFEAQEDNTGSLLRWERPAVAQVIQGRILVFLAVTASMAPWATRRLLQASFCHAWQRTRWCYLFWRTGRGSHASGCHIQDSTSSRHLRSSSWRDDALSHCRYNCNCNGYSKAASYTGHLSILAYEEGSNVTADSTDSESSSKNNSNHSTDQHGPAANMVSQFDQASQQQQQQPQLKFMFVAMQCKATTISMEHLGILDNEFYLLSLYQQTIRRLAQNREAARKSRLRKKAYIQQLESSKLKLAQMEQDIQRARAQGLLLGGAPGANTSSGAAMFDMEYARWLDEHCRRMAELYGALHAHLQDGELRAIVDETLSHHDALFRLKAIAAKSDVFHLITGVWVSPAERCYLWMGGFRPSDLLNLHYKLFLLLQTLLPQLDPLTEQQVVGIYNLQQLSQQAEEALSQGLEQLHQSLASTMAGGSVTEDPNTSFMGQMALALSKLSNLEGFVIQADNLRQQTLHQMHRILTVRQAARCFLAIGEYHNRLRALSSLWAARPRE
ncbi:hypothetical protein PR202_gb16401 [Eleusine coracana subsp. coracana]|uniref:DOG1 domain-containing protein n=1 Tax=Eleusine coracana subsp. coracana TaxID=191504 RepID=A0AAV5F0A1_ELECO|nr:hypothetical protein PR202_gb16401 [Eleusine coracana subsp. coracana]